MDMEDITKTIGALFLILYRENAQDAIALASGLLVGAIEHEIELDGGDPAMRIIIDGGPRRLTVHEVDAITISETTH